MKATATFLERTDHLEPRQLQPLPDASEEAWDRWLVEVGGAGFPSRRITDRKAALASFKRRLMAWFWDD